MQEPVDGTVYEPGDTAYTGGNNLLERVPALARGSHISPTVSTDNTSRSGAQHSFITRRAGCTYVPP